MGSKKGTAAQAAVPTAPRTGWRDRSQALLAAGDDGPNDWPNTAPRTDLIDRKALREAMLAVWKGTMVVHPSKPENGEPLTFDTLDRDEVFRLIDEAEPVVPELTALRSVRRQFRHEPGMGGGRWVLPSADVIVAAIDAALRGGPDDPAEPSWWLDNDEGAK